MHHPEEQAPINYNHEFQLSSPSPPDPVNSARQVPFAQLFRGELGATGITLLVGRGGRRCLHRSESTQQDIAVIIHKYTNWISKDAKEESTGQLLNAVGTPRPLFQPRVISLFLENPTLRKIVEGNRCEFDLHFQ